MKHDRKRFIVVGVVVAGILVLCCVGVAIRKPILEGWHLWKLDSEDDSERRIAAEKLGEMGSSKAIPRLIELLRERASNVTPSFTVGIESTDRLTYQGGEMGHYSAQALIRIGRTAVPAMTTLLRDDDPNVRWHGAYLPGELGAEAAEAVSALVQALGDERESVRLAAVYSLGRIGSSAKSAVPILVALRDQAGNNAMFLSDQAIKDIQDDYKETEEQNQHQDDEQNLYKRLMGTYLETGSTQEFCGDSGGI